MIFYRRTMFRFSLFAVVFPLSSFADVHKEEVDCPNGKRQCRATIRHIERGGIGYEDGYTTFEAFFSSDPSRWKVTPFLDARGHVFDNGKWAANVGVGLRALWGNRAYGINTYYDYRNTGRFNSNQIGAGLETLGEVFDFRINGYLPVGAKTSAPYDPIFGTFSGNYMLVSEKIQSAMKGADAEFGFHFGTTESFDFYAGAGPYYFIGEVDPSTWGGKARISGTFKDILNLEISDSYDRTFHNKFQGQISLSFSFGPKSKVKQQGRTCKVANTLNDRMLQPVGRQEIIVIDHVRKNNVGIDPATGLPYFFVFVNNTGHSDGTYESPYHTLAQAEANSSPNDIIYVFPGDGTTTGMDSGISLKANQKFWGSGVGHSIQTAVGTISIPAQSSSTPTITNTNINTDGNAINLATNNSISGFTIASAMNDAIYGADAHNLDVSFCTFKDTITFPIEATFLGASSISITDNQFLNNTNGVNLTLNGTCAVVSSNNVFKNQTSISNVPFDVIANSNTFAFQIENNIFDHNVAGSVRFGFDQVVNAEIFLLNNTITNNTSGSQDSLASSFVINPTGTTDFCSIVARDNTFSGNTHPMQTIHSIYLHTSGSFTTLSVTASGNTMSGNSGSAIVLATPVDSLTFLATDNRISALNNNGIAVIASRASTDGNITINNNTITDVTSASNGIAIGQAFTNLDLTVSNNVINGCDGTGVLCFSSEFTNITANIIDNSISNCQNNGGSAASGISLDSYINLGSTVADNLLSGNASPGVAVGFYTSGDPSVCLTLIDNSSDTVPGYSLTNPGIAAFNLSPCNANAVNIGTIATFGPGSIMPVRSCPEGTACP